MTRYIIVLLHCDCSIGPQYEWGNRQAKLSVKYNLSKNKVSSYFRLCIKPNRNSLYIYSLRTISMTVKLDVFVSVLIHHGLVSLALHQDHSAISILNLDFSNLKILEKEIRTTEEISLTSCVVRCMETTVCLSLAYHKTTQKCVLYDKDFIDVNSTQKAAESGWNYLYIHCCFRLSLLFGKVVLTLPSIVCSAALSWHIIIVALTNPKMRQK